MTKVLDRVRDLKLKETCAPQHELRRLLCISGCLRFGQKSLRLHPNILCTQGDSGTTENSWGQGSRDVTDKTIIGGLAIRTRENPAATPQGPWHGNQNVLAASSMNRDDDIHSTKCPHLSRSHNASTDPLQGPWNLRHNPRARCDPSQVSAIQQTRGSK